MSTFRQSIWWRSEGLAGVAGLLGCALLSLTFAAEEPTPGKAPKPQRPLPPFLQVFRADDTAPIASREEVFLSAAGRVKGYVARPATEEQLPAILLLPDEDGWTEWMKGNARDLASVGYVVLVPDLKASSAPPGGKGAEGVPALADEPTLARLSAAVRWLRRRGDVQPERVGVVGWGRGGRRALALAASTPMQACVVVGVPVAIDRALTAGLRGTPVLGVFAGEDTPAKELADFRAALDRAGIPHRLSVYDRVKRGFMGPPDGPSYVRQSAEDGWVEIYEFLGQYVEDAPGPGSGVPSVVPAVGEKPVATVADLMRAVNGPGGVRANLIQTLAEKPAKAEEWERVRADAAVLAETGKLLRGHTPRKGTHKDWVARTRSFRAAAEALVVAADRRDYPGARRGLQELAGQCTACHRQHR